MLLVSFAKTKPRSILFAFLSTSILVHLRILLCHCRIDCHRHRWSTAVSGWTSAVVYSTLTGVETNCEVHNSSCSQRDKKIAVVQSLQQSTYASDCAPKSLYFTCHDTTCFSFTTCGAMIYECAVKSKYHKSSRGIRNLTRDCFLPENKSMYAYTTVLCNVPTTKAKTVVRNTCNTSLLRKFLDPHGRCSEATSKQLVDERGEES